MKITNLVAITLAVTLSTNADAGRRAFSGTSNYVSNGQFGLGLELGEPTGLNGKLFLTPSGAFDFGIGDVYQNYYIDGSGLHLYADYLWHPVELAHSEAFKLPFYVGVGGRVWFTNYNCRAGICNSADVFGIRVPLGLDFDFNNIPIDVFGEFVPTLDFYHNYCVNCRSVYVDVDFSVGIRYWFS